MGLMSRFIARIWYVITTECCRFSFFILIAEMEENKFRFLWIFRLIWWLPTFYSVQTNTNLRANTFRSFPAPGSSTFSFTGKQALVFKLSLLELLLSRAWYNKSMIFIDIFTNNSIEDQYVFPTHGVTVLEKVKTTKTALKKSKHTWNFFGIIYFLFVYYGIQVSALVAVL